MKEPSAESRLGVGHNLSELLHVGAVCIGCVTEITFTFGILALRVELVGFESFIAFYLSVFGEAETFLCAGMSFELCVHFSVPPDKSLQKANIKRTLFRGFGRDNNDHTSSFKLRLLVNAAHFGTAVDKLLNDGGAQLRMSHFSSAEAHGNLNLVAVAEEFNSVAKLGVEIVGINVKGKPYFLDLDCLLIFLCFFFALCLLKAIFAVVHNAANVRGGGGRDLYEIKIFFRGDRKGILHRNNTKLRAVGVDHADFFFADLLIDEQFLFCYGLTPPNKIKKVRYKESTAQSHSEKDRALIGACLPCLIAMGRRERFVLLLCKIYYIVKKPLCQGVFGIK